ncbi:MAG: ATP-binding cassette domain-containing protein [Candidatus Omnitrophica bacterium]|nr:ATP-binding cassette domain-containing protein [Candidatus Omnitrophota bacterium]
MITVEKLTMYYGQYAALKDLSFEVRKGEILGLLGPNGAGKTTAMRILTTYLYPAAGQVRLGDVSILANPLEARKKTGYLPENVPVYPDMRVDDYVRFVAKARGLTGKQLTERVEWVREACQLKPIWKHQISEISKGYKQRVGLAQALVHDPEILILDEPTTGLDPLQILGIRDLIKNLAHEKTIIFSTHILQEVQAMADRIVIINEGRLVAQGTQQELETHACEKTGRQGPLSLEDIFIALLRVEAHEGQV